MDIAELQKEFKSVTDEFGKTVSEWKGHMSEKVKSEMDSRMGEWQTKFTKIEADLQKFDTLKAELDAVKTALNRKAITRVKSNGDVEELPEDHRETKAAYESFLRKGHSEAARGNEDMNKTQFRWDKKSLSVISDSDGGYGVHADMNGRIVKRIFETSDVRKVAAVMSISTDALEGMLDLNEVTTGWVAETGARAQTATSKLGVWRIPVYEQYAMPAATQKLLDDAGFDVEGWLAGKVADKMSRTENAAFINGNGVTQPRGMLTYAAYTGSDPNTPFGSIEQLNSGSAATLTVTSLNNAVYALKDAYLAGAEWAFSRGTIGIIRGLLDGFGRPLWQPGLQDGQPSSLLGYKMNQFNDLPAMGANALYGIFADFKEFYQIVDRQGVRVLRDPFTAKPYILFYTTKRVGGDVLNFEAGKILKAHV